MKEQNPRRYRIEGAGDWGISEGLIYTNFEKRELHLKDFLNKHEFTAFYGLDFGFTDPTAFVGGFINFDAKEIYILMELYESGLTNQDIAQRLKDMGIRHEVIKCDSAEPKSIEELRKAGINAKPASKGADSVKFGIQKIQNYKIIFDVDCVNFEHEIKNYCWAKDRQGNTTDVPDHEFSHLQDALRYSVMDLKPALHIHQNNIQMLRSQPRHRF
jgi:phage terminase large subunit